MHCKGRCFTSSSESIIIGIMGRFAPYALFPLAGLCHLGVGDPEAGNRHCSETNLSSSAAPQFLSAPSPIRPFTYLRNPKAGKSIVFYRVFDSRLATGKHPATYQLLLVGLARPPRADRLLTGSTGQFVRFVRFLGLRTGPNPTDRAELGSKRHLICDGQGGLQHGKQQQQE